MPRRTLPFDPTPETDGAYERARSYLKIGFAAWGASNGTRLETDAGEAPIHYKWNYLDGHLTRWRTVDLDQVYLELHPAKVIANEDELGPILDEARAFLTFLDNAALLDLASDDLEVLLDHVDRIEQHFRSNMADAARYSPGKRLMTQALAEGVQLDDENAMASFITRFNASSRRDRETVFGPLSPAASSRVPSGRATPPGTRPRPKQSSTRRRRERR